MSTAPLARTVLREIDRLAQAGVDWRTLLCRKEVYAVDAGHQPVPDGLSAAYIDLAVSIGERHAAEGQHAATSPFFAALEAALIAEIGHAMNHEQALLARATDVS